MSECTKWAVDIMPAQAARGLPPHLGFVLDALILVSNVACDSAVLPYSGIVHIAGHSHHPLAGCAVLWLHASSRRPA